MESKNMSSERLYATGRRKTSSARIYLSQGEGSIKINNKELSDYFGREVAQMLVKQPLELCNLIDKVDICLLYTSPSPRDRTRSRMPSSA